MISDEVSKQRIEDINKMFGDWSNGEYLFPEELQELIKATGFKMEGSSIVWDKDYTKELVQLLYALCVSHMQQMGFIK